MILFRFIARLPLPVLYALSDFLFFLSYHIVRYRRSLVKRNLVKSFPEKSPSEIRGIQREFYHNLCDYAVETLKLLRIDQADLAKRVVFKNGSILEKYRDQN